MLIKYLYLALISKYYKYCMTYDGKLNQEDDQRARLLLPARMQAREW